jgi:hypothetical protein
MGGICRIPDHGVNAGMVSDMSNVNRGDDDPGANTAMFQRFVDDGAKPGARPPWAPSRRQTVLKIAVVAAVVVVALVVVALIMQG